MASAQKEHRGAQRQKQPRHERHKLFRDAHGLSGRPPRTQRSKSPANTTPASTRGHTHGHQHRRCRAGLRHGAHAERRKHTACGINFCAVPPERLLHIADRAGGRFSCRILPPKRPRHIRSSCRKTPQSTSRRPRPRHRPGLPPQHPEYSPVPSEPAATPSRTEMRKIPRSAACRTMPRASCPGSFVTCMNRPRSVNHTPASKIKSSTCGPHKTAVKTRTNAEKLSFTARSSSQGTHTLRG